MTFADLKDGETVKIERYGAVINGTVKGSTIVGRRNDANYVTHLSISDAIRYGWKLCKI